MARYTFSDFLKDNSREDSVSFHMPGHKGRGELYEEAGYGALLKDAIKWDITEIPGADALYCPRSTLRGVMDAYAESYGVRHTELLVNGSSAGLIAAVISSVPRGGKLILGRNSHHSVFSALRLGGINPVYIRPETDPVYGLAAGISPRDLRKACAENPDASAVLITSPTACGMLSDISALAGTAHEHGMLLIVDQAHGAHLKYFDYDAARGRERGEFIPHPRHAAESLGADIVVNSTHKTLLSFTGSGILNICTDNVDTGALSDALKMVQTTSPSYLLMASLDINEKIMRGNWPEIINGWKDDLTWFYKRAKKIGGLTAVTGKGGSRQQTDGDCFGLYCCTDGQDISKINISMARLGLSGERLDKELRYRGIISEMTHGEYVLLLTGAGNKRQDYERLIDALTDISSGYGIESEPGHSPGSFENLILETTALPLEAEAVPLYESDGRVLYSPVTAYPPGTPLVCPGEIMNMEAIGLIADMIENGEPLTGVDDEGMIKVGALTT